MTMSEYYRNLREKVGCDLIFMPCVCGVIRNDLNQILFIRKHGESLWGLPAGAIEPGETPAQAVKREVLEETGLKVNPLKIIGVFGGEKYRYTYKNGHQVEYLAIIFECQTVSGELCPADGEAQELRFFDENNIPEIAIPYPKEIFRKTENSVFE